MTTTTSLTSTDDRRAGLLTGGGLAVLWLTLGFVTNGTTYHLAPLLVAGIPAVIYTFEAADAPWNRILALAIAGSLASLIVTVALSATGNLEGPTLLPFGGAAAEAVVFAPAGAALAVAIGLLRRPSRNRSTR